MGVTKKYDDDKKSHDVNRRKAVPSVTEVHAREHLLGLMASYSFSISN